MRRTIPAALAVVGIVMPWVLPAYALTLLAYVGLSALVALGLVLLTGIAGQTSFGQATFVGIAAYTSAYLAKVQGVSPFARPAGGVAGERDRRVAARAITRASRGTTWRSPRSRGGSVSTTCLRPSRPSAASTAWPISRRCRCSATGSPTRMAGSV